jgi:hypothetical protein
MNARPLLDTALPVFTLLEVAQAALSSSNAATTTRDMEFLLGANNALTASMELATARV